MRAVVQRASAARVAVDGKIIGSLDRPGLVVLLGVTHDDDQTKAATLARKIWELRILHGERSASDVGAPLLVVSQFTLYADLRKGRRPSWSARGPGRGLAAALRGVLRRAARPGGRGRHRGFRGADGRDAHQRRAGDDSG
jgi:D-aminoacyl-tRNA deacylase